MHNALNAKRWGYSAYTKQDKFPSFKSCIQECLRNIRDKELNATQSRCASCCDFDMNNNSVHNRSPLPNNYPKNQHVDSPQPPLGREVLNMVYLLPVKIFLNSSSKDEILGFIIMPIILGLRHKL